MYRRLSGDTPEPGGVRCALPHTAASLSAHFGRGLPSDPRLPAPDFKILGSSFLCFFWALARARRAFRNSEYARQLAEQVVTEATGLEILVNVIEVS